MLKTKPIPLFPRLPPLEIVNIHVGSVDRSVKKLKNVDTVIHAKGLTK